MQPALRNAIIGNFRRLPASLIQSTTSRFAKPAMQNDNPNTERYIAIARACLKAINDTAANSGSREEKIQSVYQTIDKAFQTEISEYRQAVAIIASVLERTPYGQ